MPNGARPLLFTVRAVFLEKQSIRMVALDPRINPFRPEIAAKHLQGQVEAKQFVEGVLRQVIEPTTSLRRASSHEATLESEALLGERVMIYETTEEGWAWGQLETDGYVGWLSARALGPTGTAPTHKVVVPRALVFPGSDIKLTPAAALPMGARLAVVRQDKRFAVTASGWHVPEVYLAPIKIAADRFCCGRRAISRHALPLGRKTSLGLDCSGLVQVSVQAAGFACPRDSDMQELTLGKSVFARELAPWRSLVLERPCCHCP